MKSLIKKDLGKRIKKAREERGLSQNRLAEDLEVDSVTVSRWERGVHSPTDAQLAILREKLGVDPEYFSIRASGDVTAEDLLNLVKNKNATIHELEVRIEGLLLKIRELEEQLGHRSKASHLRAADSAHELIEKTRALFDKEKSEKKKPS